MTTTGNSSFRKIRNAEGPDGLTIKRSTVGTLVADKLIASLILTGRFGSNVKTITGYTSTDFVNVNANVSTWLNTTAGLANAGNALVPKLLILPKGSRVFAAVATTPDATPLGTTGPIDIGTQALGTAPGLQTDIFASTGWASFTQPGSDVGGPTNSGATLGEPGGKVPTTLASTTDFFGVTVTPAAAVSSGSLVVTIYYV
jgi:hypothetical protein